MTDRDLIAEGRQLLAAATPGSFTVYSDNGVFAHMQSLHRLAPGKDGWKERIASNMRSADAALAVWALNNLPALLDAVEAAHRPPLGYVAGYQQGGQWIIHHLGELETSEEVDASIEKLGPGVKYHALVVSKREVQP